MPRSGEVSWNRRGPGALTRVGRAHSSTAFGVELPTFLSLHLSANGLQVAFTSDAAEGNVTNPSSGILRFNPGVTQSAGFTVPLGNGAVAVLPFVAGNGTVRVSLEVDGYVP